MMLWREFQMFHIYSLERKHGDGSTTTTENGDERNKMWQLKVGIPGFTLVNNKLENKLFNL